VTEVVVAFVGGVAVPKVGPSRLLFIAARWYGGLFLLLFWILVLLPLRLKLFSA